jgi:hypothetical protein
MKTDALIERLAGRAEKVSALDAARALVIGAAAGVSVSAMAMVSWLGIRPDLIQAMGTGAYWMKFFYTLLFALAAFWTLERLSRPGARSRTQMTLEALPFAAIALWASMRLAMAPAAARMPMAMGHSSHVCPWRIVILSLPVLAGLLWGLRKLAPTRAVLAGAACGLAAGALGAFIYAFHCNESAAAFVALWYTFGIVCVGAIGAVAGRFLLRW